MTTLPTIKQGDTFAYTATWAGALLSELKSQVRDNLGRLVAEVTIEDTGTAGTFRLYVNKTNKWPVGVLYTDIQRITTDVVQSCETMTIRVDKGVTT